MINDSLKALLERADAGREPALLPSAELAHRVERFAQQAQRRRAMTVALGAPAVLMLLGLFTWRSLPMTAPEGVKDPAMAIAEQRATATDPQTPTMTSESIEQLRQELADVEAEAELHLRIAQQLIAERERDAALRGAQNALAQEEPAELIRQRLDLIAYRMIARADQLRSQSQTSDEPAEIYREVVRLFPTTDPAAAAQARLIEIQSM